MNCTKGQSIFVTYACLCFVVVHVALDKFRPRSIKLIFIGYSVGQKGYILSNLKSGGIFVIRYVIFNEIIFTFHSIPGHAQPMKIPSFFLHHTHLGNTWYKPFGNGRHHKNHPSHPSGGKKRRWSWACHSLTATGSRSKCSTFNKDHSNT